MKKTILLMSAIALTTMSASAQKRVRTLSTAVTKMNTELLGNSQYQVKLNRTLYEGYNTICLPVSMSAAQIEKAMPGATIEKMVGIAQEGAVVNLYFVDCTAEGLSAGVPYLINAPKTGVLVASTEEAAEVSDNIETIRFTDRKGNQVSFGSSWTMIEEAGRYGIPAQQETTPLQAILIRTEGDKVFLPTRCGFVWEQQASSARDLRIRHISSLDEATAIQAMQGNTVNVDVYDLKGNILKKQVSPEQATEGLAHGVYLIGGEKVIVR